MNAQSLGQPERRFGTSARLRELGLPQEVLVEAIQKGFDHAGEFTANDPPSAKGISVWRVVVRTLRDRLVPEGWKVRNPNNYAMTVHPSEKWAIVVARGDDATAQAKRPPATQSPKGPMTKLAVQQNRQLAFWEGQLSQVWDVPTHAGMRTWILLYYWDESSEAEVDEIELMGELSLPLSVDQHGRVTEWEERIPISNLPELYQFAVTAPQISWHIIPHPSFQRRPESSEFNQWKCGGITTNWYKDKVQDVTSDSRGV